MKCIRCGEQAFIYKGRTYKLCATCAWENIIDLIEPEPVIVIKQLEQIDTKQRGFIGYGCYDVKVDETTT
jgi:hypothetical protein